MTLRLRLFLVFGGLLALSIVAQHLYLRALTDDFEAEVDRVAVLVGGSVAAALDHEFTVAPETSAQSMQFAYDLVASAPGTSVLTSDGAAAASQDPTTNPHVVIVHDQTVERIDGETIFVERRVRHLPGPPGAAHDDRVHDFDETHDDTPHSADGRQVRVEVEHYSGDDEDGERRFLWLAHADHETRVPIPQGGMRERLADLRRDMLLASLALLGGGLLIAAVVARRVAAPLQRLADATTAVGGGALGTRVEPDAADHEVRRVIEAFNAMSARLAQLDADARRAAGQRQLAEIGEVARGLAHSLRNPLNALGLTIDELIASGPDSSDERRTAADTARRQIRRLDHTVRSFLALTNRDDALDALPVDLLELAHDVALEALQDAAGRVRVVVDEDLDAPVDQRSFLVRAVPAELRAAVQALITNAVEASPAGATVRLYLRRTGERVRLTIEDEGAGVPASVRARLFTPHTTDKAHGAGMGLFLAHRLAVHRYSGSLRLDDRPEGGTAAHLELGDRVEEPVDAASTPDSGRAP
ncbi:MAG: HAMP domain-containing sensor histidine kinase [Acidobacteriota bacterium]